MRLGLIRKKGKEKGAGIDTEKGERKGDEKISNGKVDKGKAPTLNEDRAIESEHERMGILSSCWQIGIGLANTYDKFP